MPKIKAAYKFRENYYSIVLTTKTYLQNSTLLYEFYKALDCDTSWLLEHDEHILQSSSLRHAPEMLVTNAVCNMNVKCEDHVQINKK
jgi:hypothetical protein